MTETDQRAPAIFSGPRTGRAWWLAMTGSARVAIILSLILMVVLFVDRPVLMIGRNLDPSLNGFLNGLTRLGDSSYSLLITLSVLGISVAFARGRCARQRAAGRRLGGAALYLFAVVALSGIVAALAKNVIGRARPGGDLIPNVLGFEPFAFRHAYASFPSGHATTCAALAFGMAALWPQHRVAILLLGLWGALSRALIGVHWLSDVLAGIALGAAVAAVLRRSFAARGIAFRGDGAGRGPRRVLPTLRRLWAQRLGARLGGRHLSQARPARLYQS